MINAVLVGLSLGLGAGGVGLAIVGEQSVAGLFMLASGLSAFLSMMTYGK